MKKIKLRKWKTSPFRSHLEFVCSRFSGEVVILDNSIQFNYDGKTIILRSSNYDDCLVLQTITGLELSAFSLNDNPMVIIKQINLFVKRILI